MMKGAPVTPVLHDSLPLIGSPSFHLILLLLQTKEEGPQEFLMGSRVF